MTQRKHSHGDSVFLLKQLILKDFRVRYRNMSLGVLWSLLNPLVMMGVLTFVFTQVFPSASIRQFPIFVLCGIVPFNFFGLAWITGTTSIIDSSSLIRRLPVQREIIPIAAVLSNCLHLLVQIALLLACTVVFGQKPNIHWLWLPFLWTVEVIFITGLAMACSALNVVIRDTRYVVESATNVLFWLVPVFYSYAVVPEKYRSLYEFNPVTDLVLSLRAVLIDGIEPAQGTLVKFVAVSVVTFMAGWFVFRQLRKDFFEHI